MCLSTVYKNTVTPETVAMKNVMTVSYTHLPARHNAPT